MTGEHARHLRRSRRRRAGLALFSTIVVVALVVGWSVDRVLSRTLDSDASPGDGSASAVTPGGSTASPREVTAASEDGPSDPEATPADRCARKVADVEAAVRAARPGVDHWSTHVQARTDMLADRISEKRMEAIYERTQALGPEDHRRFAVAVSRIDPQSPCRELRSAAVKAAGMGKEDCLARARKAAAALAVARSTMDEWQTHLHHMEQYADGGMRTGKALQLWVRAWRKAPEGITAFDRALEGLAAAPPCAAG